MLNTDISPTERAWSAGFFDGEGCTSVHVTYTGQAKSSNPRMSISQVEDGEAILERFQKAVGGLGNRALSNKDGSRMCGKYATKPIRIWYVTGMEKVQTVLGILWPYLHTVKRAQAKTVLAKVIETHLARPERSRKISEMRILSNAARRVAVGA